MTTTQDEVIERLFDIAVNQLAKGDNKLDVINGMIDLGVPVQMAENVTEAALTFKKKTFRRAGLQTIGFGVGLFALGGIISGITYAVAPGGHYIVTTGLFFVGILTVLKGVWKFIRG
ncbi:hypothetical protein ACP6H1_27430 [Vibrio harveyi]|uniref:hypothetical protein n=1 Tax=Vibrio harveyi TaxID=669 RepID=UPI003CE7BCE5